MRAQQLSASYKSQLPDHVDAVQCLKHYSPYLTYNYIHFFNTYLYFNKSQFPIRLSKWNLWGDVQN